LLSAVRTYLSFLNDAAPALCKRNMNRQAPCPAGLEQYWKDVLSRTL